MPGTSTSGGPLPRSIRSMAAPSVTPFVRRSQPDAHRRSPPAGEYRLAIEERDAHEQQRQPQSNEADCRDPEHARGDPRETDELGDENRRYRKDEKHAELLRRARIVDAGRDHYRDL